ACIAGSAGCTSAGSRVHAPAATSASPIVGGATRPCTAQQIRSAVQRFFSAWNGHDTLVLSRLFRGQGELDMATKHQDTLHDHAWSTAAGPAKVDAFAERQWLLGERLSHRGMTIYTGPYSAGHLGGAEVNEVGAKFADGTVQPIEEAKFNYDCGSGAFTHVVIISAGSAHRAIATRQSRE